MEEGVVDGVEFSVSRDGPGPLVIASEPDYEQE
jgi:hypothetical protein